MKRYVSTFFRRKWLYSFVLLVLLAASVVGAIFLTSDYASTARIWVDRSPLDSVVNQNATYQMSPAQEQSGVLQQLVATDSFMTSVMKGTSAGDKLTGNPDTDHAYIDKLRPHLTFALLGSNVISITYTGNDANLCQQMVQNTIDQYRQWKLQTGLDQTSAETQYYEQQIKNYQDQMNQLQAQINDFTSKNPTIEQSSPALLTLQGLQNEYDRIRALYSSSLDSLNRASVLNNLTNSENSSTFRTLDVPTIPQQPATTLKSQAKYVILGIVASLSFVIGAVVLVTWQDKVVRNVDDLTMLDGVPVLATLPHLKGKKRPRRDRSGTGRQARTNAASRRRPVRSPVRGTVSARLFVSTASTPTSASSSRPNGAQRRPVY